MLVKVFPNNGKKGKRGETYFSTDPKLFIMSYNLSIIIV